MFVSLAQFRQMASFLSREQLAGMMISVDDLLNLPPSVLSAPTPSPADLIILEQYAALIQARLAPLSQNSGPATPASVSSRLPERLTAPSSRASPIFRPVDLPSISQAMEVDSASQMYPRPRPVGTAAVQCSGTMPPPSYSAFGSPARRSSPTPEALTIHVPPLSRVSSQNSAKRRCEDFSPPAQQVPSVPVVIRQPVSAPLPKVTAEEPIDISDDEDEDYVEGSSKKAKARPRREEDLVTSTGLSLGGDPLSGILDVFAFSRVADLPATPCINCLTRFLPTCTHGDRQFRDFPLGPTSWSEAPVHDDKKANAPFLNMGVCDTCNAKHISHCDHAKPPCLTQFIAESVQPAAMLAGSNLKRRMRNTQVAISQAKLSKLNDRVCQANARLSIMELTMDLSTAFDLAAKPASFWVKGGYFDSEDRFYEVLEAAYLAATREVSANDREIQSNFEAATQDLFSAHCTILEWLGELTVQEGDDHWRWYTTPDEEGESRYPIDHSFFHRNAEAIRLFKEAKEAAKVAKKEASSSSKASDKSKDKTG
ncbi:hypothetical protein AGABI2DRAFT_119963 [Agaricus bisporus var. bisporus H97]|uniref:hypothetical protein n=1 Tax=Agaricus bisporus var. bisporus (strain H97 / ATCC MYA-4626 / FGSC 10389) TaxID=936046 RepID=UPI00029F6D1E|nr:hypothetical protein AGABI2DRAFT_119963 [Agaricus bisporus var. bisporus H97]EKV44993.1 hypothetical protein AGABI2DRAFT_119963 [Agaricus bisporus var. bisporus H97]